ncbi:MAG: dephospho-CoA kinase [Elusimicrobiota bacterium]
MPERLIRKPLRVGLTGGIGAGKSEALRAFSRAGAWTLSLDEVSRRLSRRGGPVHRAIVRAFGRGVLRADGSLDRAKLASRVFASPIPRRRLDRAAHPPMLLEMRRRLRACRRPVAVVDVPLLFEAGLAGDFDATVLVSAPERLRLGRVMRRDGVPAAAARARLRSQWPQERKERLADVVVRNQGGLGALCRRVKEYQQAFRLLSTSPGGSGA